MLQYAEIRFCLGAEAIVANYVGGGKLMDYNLSCVTLMVLLSNEVLFSEKMCSLICLK